MFDKILSVFSNVVTPVTKMIDDLNTSDEEKLILKNQLQESINNAKLETEKIVTERIKEQSLVIRAEINSGSWLAQNWRPSLMALFGIIIANNYIIAPYMSALADTSVSLPIPPEMWDLLKLGISGYIVSRGAEKGIEKWKAK